MNKYLKLIFFIVLTVDAMTYHSKPGFYDRERDMIIPFNQQYELIGIDAELTNDISIGASTFVNSKYQRSNAVDIDVRLYRWFWMRGFYVTGYDEFNVGLWPVVKFDFRNIIFELSYIPAINRQLNTQVLILTKKVRF